MDGELDIAWLGEGLIPGRRRALAAHPGTVGDRLDRLDGDVALGAGRLEGVEVLGEVAVLHRDVVEGQQHGVEVEADQAAAVRSRDLSAVAGDADRPHEALLAGFDGSVDHAARAQCGVPLDRVGEVVHLPEVDVVAAQPLQRPL